MPDGKPPSEFAYDSQCLDRAFALKVIEETHGFYVALKSGATPNTKGLALA